MHPSITPAGDPGGDPSAGAAAARADTPTSDNARATAGRSQPRLFRSVWRWHFYAGLLSIPVIVLLGLSGIVYLFKPQIDAVAYGSLRDVPVRAERTTYAAQSAAVQRAYPGSTITGLAPPPAADRASEFDLSTAGGRDLRVYVDPYTATVTGDREPSRSLTTLALDLHGTLLTSRFLDEEGKVGDRLIELTASWAVVLVVTGLYLWWPRGRRGFRDALRPRLRSKSSRTRWRDLHAVTGVMFGFVTLFFLITGLAWTGVWGAKFNEIATKSGALYPEGLYDGAQSTVADTVKHGKAAWAAGSLPLQPSAARPAGATADEASAPSPDPATAAAAPSTPATSTADSAASVGSGSPGEIPESGGRPGHTGHSGHADPSGASAASQLTGDRPDVELRGGDVDGHTGHTHAATIVWDPAKGAPIDAIVGRAEQLGFPAGFTVAYPEDARGSYTVSRFPDADVAPNAPADHERIAYLDQYTALPIRDHRYADFGAIGQATDFGIALHEGRQWGIWSQLFSLFGTLALLLSCATAIVMWRKRKPQGLGSPRRPPNRKLGAGVVAITLGLGLLFPLLGLSIVVLLVFDFLVVRHVPPLARALGAR